MDLERWAVPSKGQAFIREQGGVLNFVLSPQAEDVGWSIEARPSGVTIEEASVTLALQTEGTTAPGAVGLSAKLSDGRVVLLDFGPGPNGAGTEISLCPDNSAGYYECLHPDSPDSPEVDVRQPVDLKVTHDLTSTTSLYVNGTAFYEQKTAPMIGVALNFYADAGSTFHITADNFYMRYRD
jgi:hypothetical protein